MRICRISYVDYDVMLILIYINCTFTKRLKYTKTWDNQGWLAGDTIWHLDLGPHTLPRQLEVDLGVHPVVPTPFPLYPSTQVHLLPLPANGN